MKNGLYSIHVTLLDGRAGKGSGVILGVSGTFTDTRAEMTGTALVGKASLIFGATLRKLADID
jgi:hypothetical protein